MSATLETYTQAVSTAARIGTSTTKRTMLAIFSPTTAAATVWLGDENVSASDGIPLAPGERIVFTNDGGGQHASHAWFAFASSSVTLQITEGY